MSSDLETFIALLALDQGKRDQYLGDPETALEDAGLEGSAAAQRLGGALEKVCKELSQVNYPPPTEEPEGGSG